MAWTTYKGVNVPDVTTSDAGTYLADDVRTLADRVVFTAAADPTATNDTTQGFAPGSEWLNTATLQTWECISAATGAAVWSQVIQVASGSVNFNSDVGIGEASPTALLHLKAGTASAGTAPIKLTSGTLLTTPEVGAIEYDGTNFYATPSSAVREKLAYADGSNTTGLVIEGPGTSGQNTIQPTASSVVPLTLQQFSTSTADLTDWKNAGGTVLASVSSAGTITAPLVTGLGTPSNPADAANKQYVDATVQGLQIKPTANLATTSALPTNTYSNGSSGVGATLTATSNGALTVDSVAVTAGMLILVKNESTAANNGLYVVTAAGDASHPYVLTRSVDMDTAGQFAGAFVPVDNQGAANANTLWLANPSGTVTVGTTAIPFSQLNSATSLTPGTGITIAGSTISIASSYAGQSSITTLGTIGTGTWNGTTIALANGGTGATTAIGAIDALHTESTSIASATTPDLSTATGDLVHITGTTTITGFASQTAGIERTLVFDGALTLTYNATSLILPTKANIVTAAGDTAVFRSEGSGNWRCIGYQPAGGYLLLAPYSTASNTIIPANTTAVPLTLKMASGSFTNALEIYNATGGLEASIDRSGTVICGPVSAAGIIASDVGGVTIYQNLVGGFFTATSNGGLQWSNSPSSGNTTKVASLYLASTGVVAVGTGPNSGAANLRLGHLIGGSSAPTIAANTGAGTSPTVSMTSGSTDLAGQISCLTGTVTPGANDVLTITFNAAFGTAPWVVFAPANAAAAALTGGAAVYVGGSTTTTFKLSVGTTGLTSTTTYLWNYHVLQ